jgi:uncharacterized damage-inducible protein DinB
MKPDMKWFDRKFSFDLHSWMFPGLVERLRGTPAQLEDRLLGVEPARLIEKHGQEWSIQENAGHLVDLEPLWLGRLQDIKDGLETMRPADLTNRRTHEANHNEDDIARLLFSFRAVREKFVGELDELDEDFILKYALHPRLKTPMRVLDLVFFVAEHDDHHLAGITQLMIRPDE